MTARLLVGSPLRIHRSRFGRSVVGIALASLLLAGCYSNPPGAAAVVDGHTISMKTADNAAHVYCRLTLVSAQQQGTSSVSNSEVRRQAVADLVMARIADQVAKDKNLHVPTAAYSLSDDQRRNLAELVPDVSADRAVDVVQRTQRLYVIAGLLGKKTEGAEAGTDDLQSAGLDELLTVLDHTDVRYDPRFGLNRGSQVRKAVTGSLSVSDDPEFDAAQQDLPASQRCA